MTRAVMLASLRAILAALSDWASTGYAPRAVNEIANDVGSALRRLEALDEQEAA